MRFVRWLHKWVGLIAGLQMFVWLASGLVMSLLDHHVVSGDSTAAEATPVALGEGEQLVDPHTVLASASGPVQRVDLERRLDRWVWRVEAQTGVRLYDAASGEQIPIDSEYALALAAEARAGDATPAAASLLTAPTLEARNHPTPLWRVDFNDAQRTAYYIAADDGRILERRTGDWRVFDVFWMLHTMDYRGRDDFHHPLVITFALLALWLALTGVLLLFRSFRKEIRVATKNT